MRIVAKFIIVSYNLSVFFFFASVKLLSIVAEEDYSVEWNLILWIQRRDKKKRQKNEKKANVNFYLKL